MAADLRRPLGRSLRGRGLLVVLVLLGVLSVVAGGCGSDDDSTAEPEAVELTIATADYSEVRGDVTTLEGTVEPDDATVQVGDVTADVSAGQWTARVRLAEVGDNRIEVNASKEGLTGAEATTVIVRKRTKAELASLREQKAKARARAERRREAAAARRARQKQQAAERAAAAAAARQTTVPNLIDERLDVAKDTLRSAGLRWRVIGGGAFGVVVESNWTVCETRPAPGASAEKGSTRVALIVDRVC